MNPLMHPLAHIRSGVTVTVSEATARVIYELTNTGTVASNRGRDFDGRVVAELGALLNVGANASVAASADGSSDASARPSAEELMLSGKPSDGVLGITTAAEVIGIGRRGVRLACEEQRLPARFVEGRWLISQHDAAEFKERRRKNKAA